MATIKDIAKLAGVSQGTVSNVLNKKDNVSSDKIRKVLKAADELSYIPNNSAKNLRKGFTEQLHLILPNINSKIYVDIYQSFKISAKQDGLEINLMITDDDVNQEIEFLNNLLPDLESDVKIAIVTCLPYGSKYENIPKNIFNNILFLIRDYIDSIHFLGFDHISAASQLSKSIISKKINNVCLISNQQKYKNEIEFTTIFKENMYQNNISVNHIFVDFTRKHQSILEQVHNRNYEAYILSDYELAPTLNDILKTFTFIDNPNIFTISPLLVVPNDEYSKYEMSYRLLGHQAAEELKNEIMTVNSQFIKADGIREWSPKYSDKKNNTLNLLTVENPSANILKHLSIKYTEYTDVEVNVVIKPYEEVFEILSSERLTADYDIIRTDINWMSWFAQDIFSPINRKNKNIKVITDNLIDGLLQDFLLFDNKLYGLPYSPSAMVLYYRKDLFERIDLKRLFKEKYKTELAVPKTFEEFNRISQFFSRDFNSNSPTTYGSTLTTGNSGVAGSEVLARYFEKTNTLFGEDGKLYRPNYLYNAFSDIRDLQNSSSIKYSPWWTDTAKAFAQGDIAMCLLYSNYAAELLSYDSKVLNKIGQSSVPGGNPLIGGGVLGIVKTTNNYDDALNFITWLSSETVSSLGSLLGNLPSSQKTFSYYEIIDKYPWHLTTKDGIMNSECFRISNRSYMFNEKEMLEIIGKCTIDLVNNMNVNINSILDTIIKKSMNSNNLFKK